MKAKNEAAERFQAKIADEVIPSIRKHGGYIAWQDTMSDDELLARALAVAKSKIEESERRIASLRSENSTLSETIEDQKPMVLFAKAVETSDQSVLVGVMAKILKQNGVNIGQNRLFDWMRDNGYLIKRRGSDYNMPTQTSMELGLFEIKESTSINPDGSVRVNKTPKITGKGQQYFVSKFLTGDGQITV